MTDNELLLAISSIFDKKLKPIEERLQALEEKVQSLEDRMNSLEERMYSLEERMYSLERRMCAVEGEIQSLKEEVRLLKLQNENNILPRLQNIEACYTSTYERYKSEIARVDHMQTDIDIIKSVVTEHGRRLDAVYS